VPKGEVPKGEVPKGEVPATTFASSPAMKSSSKRLKKSSLSALQKRFE
jgi:hypothetical protein